MATGNAGEGNGMVGEFRSGPISGTTIIKGVTFAQKGLQYAEVDGLAMFEGDIVLGTVEELQAADAGLVVESIGITGGVNSAVRWPNGLMPYEVDPALPNQQRVTDAIAHWQNHTRIRFVQRTAANAAQYPDYVVFQPGGGCSSSVAEVVLGPSRLATAVVQVTRFTKSVIPLGCGTSRAVRTAITLCRLSGQISTQPCNTTLPNKLLTVMILGPMTLVRSCTIQASRSRPMDRPRSSLVKPCPQAW